METEKKIAQFDIYCDCCSEKISKGMPYFEDTLSGDRFCQLCEEAV